MPDAVHWVLEAEITGERDALDALMAEMVAGVRAEEPGCLLYEWYTDADGGRLHILEAYRDDTATLAHISRFEKDFAFRLFALIRPTRFTVYGDPGEAVRKAVAPLRPVWMGWQAGLLGAD